jgi:ubiquinone/menaquinone biosynthesis C-methylase UbiE
MSYEQFALLYDELMSDMPYDKWVAFVDARRREAGVSGTSLLDLACGTGNIALPLAKAGYQVTGVDLSDDMLTIAQQKLAATEVSLSLYQQDMRELELPQTFDIVTIFCDSLNYITEEEDVKETFSRVYRHVKENGLFLFDVHSLYKMHHIFLNETYTINEEDVALIWHCFEGEKPNSVEHELTFFVKDDGDIYRRFEEFHMQRTYELEQLQHWLEEAGFQLIGITGDFEVKGSVTDTTERVFFTAQKKRA